MKYARLSTEGVVIEVFTPPTGFSIPDCFHPIIASQFQACPEEVDQNWTLEPDGSFTAPITPEE